MDLEKGFLAGHSGPGVVVIPAWWGLNDFCKDFCNRLAGQGFTVLALDLYEGKVAADIASAEALRDSLNRDAVLAAVKSAVALLRQKTGGPLGLVGFSLGAYFALWTMDNRPKDIAATVIFYGAGGGRFRRTKSPVQGHFAEKDPYEDPEYIAAMEKRLVDMNIAVTFYHYPGTQHWFMESDRPEYDPAAASLAWERMLAFLKGSLPKY